MARKTTPTATCSEGHTHVSLYAAQVCERNAADLAAMEEAVRTWPLRYGQERTPDLTQAERTALTGLPCSR